MISLKYADPIIMKKIKQFFKKHDKLNPFLQSSQIAEMCEKKKLFQLMRMTFTSVQHLSVLKSPVLS